MKRYVTMHGTGSKQQVASGPFATRREASEYGYYVFRHCGGPAAWYVVPLVWVGIERAPVAKRGRHANAVR